MPCQLVDGFGVVVQAVLGVLALSSLVWKRFTESPKRPLTVWFFDTSKQATGGGTAHATNVMLGLVMGSVGEAHGESTPDAFDPAAASDQCVWYFLFLALECTLGVAILCSLLQGLNYYAQRFFCLKHFVSGEYGDPPRVKLWLKQLLAYQALLLVMKCLLAALVLAVHDWLRDVGRALLAPLEPYPRLELLVVMVIVPLVLSIFSFWVQDNVLKSDTAFEQMDEADTPAAPAAAAAAAAPAAPSPQQLSRMVTRDGSSACSEGRTRLTCDASEMTSADEGPTPPRLTPRRRSGMRLRLLDGFAGSAGSAGLSAIAALARGARRHARGRRGGNVGSPAPERTCNGVHLVEAARVGTSTRTTAAVVSAEPEPVGVGAAAGAGWAPAAAANGGQTGTSTISLEAVSVVAAHKGGDIGADLGNGKRYRGGAPADASVGAVGAGGSGSSWAHMCVRGRGTVYARGSAAPLGRGGSHSDAPLMQQGSTSTSFNDLTERASTLSDSAAPGNHPSGSSSVLSASHSVLADVSPAPATGGKGGSDGAALASTEGKHTATAAVPPSQPQPPDARPPEASASEVSLEEVAAPGTAAGPSDANGEGVDDARPGAPRSG